MGDNFDWNTFDSFDFSAEETDTDSGGASDDSWGGSWGWRKKRDLPGVGKAEILTSAVQNIVSHLEHGLELNPKMKALALSRKRRQSFGMLGQSMTQQYDERKKYSDMINTCWVT